MREDLDLQLTCVLFEMTPAFIGFLFRLTRLTRARIIPCASSEKCAVRERKKQRTLQLCENSKCVRTEIHELTFASPEEAYKG